MTTISLITAEECRSVAKKWRQENHSIALVPTMGALHEGHLSLINKARDLADRVIVSIFVNPTQFGPTEDFAKYPRSPARDMEILQKAGVDALFSPTANEMYEARFQTWVANDEISTGLCGGSRPGHFRGVCTVVLKLINLTQADYCVFGKKDYQQLKIVERMVKDLNINTSVVGCETLRTDVGLALSSRNQRLSPAELGVAPSLFLGLNKILQAFVGGNHDRDQLIQIFLQEMAQTPEIEIDYIEIRRKEDLDDFSREIDAPAVILVAARLGSVRLIDNLELGI